MEKDHNSLFHKQELPEYLKLTQVVKCSYNSTFAKVGDSFLLFSDRSTGNVASHEEIIKKKIGER